MTGACIRCGTTDHVVPDEYGFGWCPRCYGKTRADVEVGLRQLERYLAVKARKSVTARIREYTDGPQ